MRATSKGLALAAYNRATASGSCCCYFSGLRLLNEAAFEKAHMKTYCKPACVIVWFSYGTDDIFSLNKTL